MRLAKPLILLVFTAAALTSCSSSSSGSPTGASGGTLEIVTVSGAPLTAAAGDALPLKVVTKNSDGTTEDVPSADVTWWSASTVVASSPDADAAANPYPATGGATPVGIWISNPPRTDHGADLTGVLFILDPGTMASGAVTVSASVTGASATGASAGQVSATVAVSPSPTGDAIRGASLYGPSGANCAGCHGATGHGSPDSTDGGMTYLIEGVSYAFPAPGLNAEPGNAGAEWSPALFAIASRADLDDGAVSLRLPMPNWLATPNPGNGKSLSTQDFADIFAFMATQTQRRTR